MGRAAVLDTRRQRDCGPGVVQVGGLKVVEKWRLENPVAASLERSNSAMSV